MSYIELSLQPGEKILCKAQVHWMAYIFPFVMTIGMLLCGGFSGSLSGVATTELALTDKRVIGKMGAVKRKHLDLPHAAVETVRVKQGLFGLLFDYGTIIIAGNGRKMKFHGIIAPVDLQLQIEEAIEMAVLGRVLSQVETRKF